MKEKNSINIKNIAAVLLLGLGLGYGLARLQHRHSIAGYDAREAANQAKIKANEAEKDKLRDENNVIRDQNEALRQDIATLSASEEALKQFVKEHGGAIAAEGQKLEQINEQLKNDQAIINAPSDRCTRCRRFSATALAAELIDKPLACAEDCAGTVAVNEDAQVSEVKKQLHDAGILFNPPLEMQQGVRTRIEARVPFGDIGPTFGAGLNGPGRANVEPMQVSATMKVVLVGNRDAFLIEKFGNEDQVVVGKPFAQWEWDVTPLRSGNQTLHLQASAIIYLKGGKEPFDKPVIDKTIQVKVDRWYATKKFVGNYWQWLSTVLVIPLGGWLWQRRRKKTRRPAGFRGIWK